MLYANTSKARLSGKDMNVPVPPKATRINAGEFLGCKFYKYFGVLLSPNHYNNLRYSRSRLGANLASQRHLYKLFADFFALIHK